MNDFERLEECVNYEECGDLCVFCNMCGRFNKESEVEDDEI